MEGSLHETLDQNELMTMEERSLLKNSFDRIKLKVCSFWIFCSEICAIKTKTTPTMIIQFWRAICFLFNLQFKKFENPLSMDENDDASPSTEGLKGIEEMLDNYNTLKEYLDDISRLVNVYSQRYRGDTWFLMSFFDYT